MSEQRKKPFLYFVVCAAGIAGDVGKLITAAQDRGWEVGVVATPSGLGFIDVAEVEERTGYPVRSAWRSPGDQRSMPPADAIAVAPATFNTINKWAAGFTDTLALGILCEAHGLGIPTAVLPYVNSALAAHPAYRRSMDVLRDMGVFISSCEPHSAEEWRRCGSLPVGGSAGPARPCDARWSVISVVVTLRGGPLAVVVGRSRGCCVITAMRVDLDARQIQDLVDVRMERQSLLARADVPKLWAVIDEAALRRIESRPAVLREQLEHLLNVEPRTNVILQLLQRLQLLPFEAGFHSSLYGSFMLMGFPEPNPDVVWVENLTNSVYFEGSDDVGRHTEVFDYLRATALGPPETRSRIKYMLKELQE